MGKTYRSDNDDAEYYKTLKLQRDQEQRRKKQKGKSTFDKEDSNDRGEQRKKRW